IEPEMRRSVNGVLQTTLRCAYSYRDIGGVRLYVRSYEGGSPGPTLRMKPGETLTIRMPNDLPPNRNLMPMDLSNPTKGSYLYHPHHHGSADIQVASGMASVQQHELPFPRQPRGPRRHLRQRHALDGAGRDLRHRDHPAQGPQWLA